MASEPLTGFHVTLTSGGSEGERGRERARGQPSSPKSRGLTPGTELRLPAGFSRPHVPALTPSLTEKGELEGQGILASGIPGQEGVAAGLRGLQARQGEGGGVPV